MRNLGAPELLLFLILFVPLGLIPAAIARRKGRSFAGFWIFGIFFWLIALIVALVIPPSRASQKQCTECRSWIPRDATRCASCTAPQPA